MVEGLERRQQDGDLHFVTFSCFHRVGYLGTAGARDLFEEALGSPEDWLWSSYRYYQTGEQGRVKIKQ
jgi:hypothetical protein